MAELIIHTGAASAQGIRPNNEDTFVVDQQHQVFLVADGMGGQELGEKASGMAAEILPRLVREKLGSRSDTGTVLQEALAEANQAIVSAGKNQAPGRRMGTTAVLAVQQADQVYVAGLGDSRAYLIRGRQVEQLTVDHSVAKALESSGMLTAEQAKSSPWQHVLYKFLGCAEMSEGAEVRPFRPQAGDRLLLASDGLTNHITEEDLREGPVRFPDPQAWADYLVPLALQRGSRDNVTCVVVAFDPA
jgi:serine/threonine protein phosphatase PrpC